MHGPDLFKCLKCGEEGKHQTWPRPIYPLSELNEAPTVGRSAIPPEVDALAGGHGVAVHDRLEVAKLDSTWGKEQGETAEPHKDENRTFMADFHRWADAQRGYRLWWSALALAVVVPAFFLLGVLVELQFQIVPPHDPSGGWSRHIWDNYGPAIAECAMEAKRTDRTVKCLFEVRKP